MAAEEFDFDKVRDEEESLFYNPLDEEYPEAVQACVAATARIVVAAIENGIAKSGDDIVHLYEKVFTKAVSLLELE